ncbi:MAG: hypothetical protein ACJAR8_001481 [Bacteroidia bacterium]|jgi:hypothetical protein
MKIVLSSVLLCFSFLAFAQEEDSSKVTFGYEDSTKIEVEILMDDPLQDMPVILYGGIGTIGNTEASQLAFNLRYENPFNINNTFSAQLLTSLQDFSKSGMLNIEATLHRSVYSSIKKSDMKLKLTEHKSNKEEVYYASYPFQLRHQLVVDAGLALMDFNSDLTLNTLPSDSGTVVVTDRRYINALLGASYVRTRSVFLKVNTDQNLQFYTKLKVGAGLGINLTDGHALERIDSNGLNTMVGDTMIPGVNLSKLGVNFNLGYSFETARPGWIISIDVLGRFVPRYKGDAIFESLLVDIKQENFEYSKILYFAPTISIGYVLR